MITNYHQCNISIVSKHAFKVIALYYFLPLRCCHFVVELPTERPFSDLSLIYSKQSFHMSQWTYTALTQNDAYYPYSKQVAYHTISYFSSMFLLIKIRTASSMHSGVKQCIPHIHQIFFGNTQECTWEQQPEEGGPDSDTAISTPMRLCIIHTEGGFWKF